VRKKLGERAAIAANASLSSISLVYLVNVI